jgi:hypothetical protein
LQQNEKTKRAKIDANASKFHAKSNAAHARAKDKVGGFGNCPGTQTIPVKQGRHALIYGDPN